MKRDVYHAISDPTRRAILMFIAVHAMTPNALAEKFDSTRQAVSKHIKVLSECRLITKDKVGREIFYKLDPDKLSEIDVWLEKLRNIWKDRFKQLDRLLINLNSKSDEN